MAMKIGLIDVDGHHFPNLALMKISAWHKARGDHAEWWDGFMQYDCVYMSRVFDDAYSADEPEPVNACEIIKGGTGYGLKNRLPDAVEHMMPDYGLYGIKDTAYGFLTRGCPRGCGFCIVQQKEGSESVQVADLSEFWREQKQIKLLDPNLMACRDRMKLLQQLAASGAWVDFTQGLDVRLVTDETAQLLSRIRIKEIHFAWDSVNDEELVLRGLKVYARYAARKPHGHFGTVYVLTNYGSTHEQDLYRIYALCALNYEPYVMVYDKPHAPRKTLELQRWCNNRIIFHAEPDFSRYCARAGLAKAMAEQWGGICSEVTWHE